MIALLLAAALSLQVQDTVGVAVQLSRPRVAAGEIVVLDIAITTPGPAPDDIRLPELAGSLQIAGTRRYDEYSIRLPGGRVRTTRLEVHLRPRRPGRYAIPPVVVLYDGRRFASRALTLEVVEAGGATQPGLAVPNVEGFSRSAVGPDAEALLRARLEPDTVWVGQQATLVVEALVSSDLHARLRRAPEYLTPSVSGMWTQDLPSVDGTHVEWSGPRRYDVQTFRRAYFPLEAGSFEIPEARLIYEARRGFLFTPYTEELTTPAMRLVVRPLPEDSVPPSFTGAVGDYSISATIEPSELAVGDAALLTVVVSGSGNLKALPAPRIPQAPVTLDSPTEDADVDGAQGTVSGRKTFTWVVVPEEPGLIRIGPIEYGYFDPGAGDYRVARTDVLSMEVAPADPAAAAGPPPPEALRGLRTVARPDPFGALRGATGAALALAPLALAGVALAARRSRARARAFPSRRALRRRLHERLDRLGEPGALEDAAFFERLGAAARDWLADRVGAPELREAGPATLAARLEQLGLAAPLVAATRDLLERVARAPYQPVPPGVDERRRLIAKLRDDLGRVDRVAGPAPGARRARRGRAGRYGASLVVLVALAASAAAATEVAAPSLEAVARARDAGRAAEAAALARDYVQHAPRDASGWYDLGTVEAGRGHRAYASWALLRALALEPRAGDVRHNLDVLAVSEAARRAAAPALPLRPGETRALALAAWWLAVACACVLAVRRSRRWLMAVAVTGSLALLLGAMLLGGRLMPDAAYPLRVEAALRAAPHLRAPVRDDAGGDVLRVIERRDDWLRVRNAAGAEGWIERREVGLLR